jgi:hypothetical protein
MPRIMVNMKLTEEERALLAKRAVVLQMTEADYLRVCMLVDSVLDGDRDAVRIVGGNLREKVGRRVANLLGFEFKNAPVKA